MCARSPLLEGVVNAGHIRISRSPCLVSKILFWYVFGISFRSERFGYFSPKCCDIYQIFEPSINISVPHQIFETSIKISLRISLLLCLNLAFELFWLEIYSCHASANFIFLIQISIQMLDIVVQVSELVSNFMRFLFENFIKILKPSSKFLNSPVTR